MTVVTVKRSATYADVLAAPANVVAELLAGSLVTHPRPAPRHAVAASRLGGSLMGPLEFGNGGPGGWIFVDEPELHLGDSVLVPDIAGWRRERLPALPETPYLTIAPDWVCEVLSPSTQRFDRGVKRRLYGEAGVQDLWLLDPDAQVLEAYRAAGTEWLLAGTVIGAGEVRLPPFEAISFSLSLLFPFDPPLNGEPPAEG